MNARCINIYCQATVTTTLHRCADCYELRDEERIPCQSCGTEELVATEFYCDDHRPSLNRYAR